MRGAFLCLKEKFTIMSETTLVNLNIFNICEGDAAEKKYT
jgi:hypothetical protein